MQYRLMEQLEDPRILPEEAKKDIRDSMKICFLVMRRSLTINKDQLTLYFAETKLDKVKLIDRIKIDLHTSCWERILTEGSLYVFVLKIIC